MKNIQVYRVEYPDQYVCFHVEEKGTKRHKEFTTLDIAARELCSLDFKTITSPLFNGEEITYDFVPFHAIEWRTQFGRIPIPVRCFPLTPHEQSIFWKNFKTALPSAFPEPSAQ